MKTIILLLLSLNVFSQTLPSREVPHGTLIYAGIFNNGILIAADSRNTIFGGYDTSGNKLIIGHYDSVQKIFKIGNFYMLITGTPTMRNIDIADIISDFNKKNIYDSTILKTYQSFRGFLINKYKVKETEIKDNLSYLMCGYENKQPIIVYIDSGRITQKNTMFSCYFSNEYEKYYFCPAVKPGTCEAQEEAVSVVFEFSAINNETIGGPLNMLKINSDNSSTIIKSFTFCKRYISYKAFAIAVANEQVPIIYKHPLLKKQFIEGAKTYLKCSKCLDKVYEDEY